MAKWSQNIQFNLLEVNIICLIIVSTIIVCLCLSEYVSMCLRTGQTDKKKKKTLSLNVFSADELDQDLGKRKVKISTF